MDERVKTTGQYISPDEKVRIVSELDKAFTRLGITISSTVPQVRIAAGIISIGYKSENIMLEFKNKYILAPRIENKFPGYFDPTSDFNRHRSGGGGSGGGW